MLLTVQTVQFLSLPVSLTSGEYPLLTSATQDLSSYVIQEYTMNVPEDLQMSIIAPDFALWERCNMVRIHAVEGRLYWIVDAQMVTDNQKAVRFTLTYCGPSSLIHKNDTAVGLFSRLPENKCPWLTRAAISSSLQHVDTYILPRLSPISDDEGVFWLQVTMAIGTTDPEYVRKGCFVRVKSNGAASNQVGWYDDATSAVYYYPSLDEIMSDPAASFLTQASSIQDISISARCPYTYDMSTIEGVKCYTLTHSGTKVPPTDPSASTENKSYTYNFKTLTAANLVPDAQIYSFYYKPGSNLEIASGTITIRDEDTNSVGTIPGPLISMSESSSGIAVDVQCIADMNSLTTYITYGGYTCAIPEGHLPYLGSQWDEYRAYSLAYDRQAMENSIDFSNQRVAVGIAQNAASTIQSAAMGAIGGNVAGAAVGAISGAASFAISTWATMKESDISEAETRATQELAERRVQGQPCTAYNSGYGLIYAIRAIRTPASIWVEMPAGLTSSIDDDYTACFGYPAEGLRSVTFGEGYYKGMLYATSKLKGPRFDKLNQTLQNGFRFKEV